LQIATQAFLPGFFNNTTLKPDIYSTHLHEALPADHSIISFLWLQLPGSIYFYQPADQRRHEGQSSDLLV
jgi:hypothetical protein